MSRQLKRAILVVMDAILLSAAFSLALFIRLDGIALDLIHSTWLGLGAVVPVYLVCFFLFGLYQRMWQYASIGELASVVGAISVGTAGGWALLVLVTRMALSEAGAVMAVTWLSAIVFVGGSRLAWRVYRDYRVQHEQGDRMRRVLIVGAGDGGVLAAKELQNHYGGRVRLVGFVDDDLSKRNMRLLGAPVLGGRNSIPVIVPEYRVDEIIIAIPSAPGKQIREIVELCQGLKAKVSILPGLYDLIDGNVTVSQIRDVQVEDLLGRDPVRVDLQQMTGFLRDQTVLITGAGGSIGSELCRQVARFSPKKLLILDVAECGIYDIELELQSQVPGLPIIPLVKDVRDRKAILDVFRKHNPGIVFHAAAHKHVPLMEANPEEAIKNNVMGTYHVAQAAAMFGAEKFILISTDKAVNPTSIMGASKRTAEMFVSYLNEDHPTCFAAVRFGNVLGSRGSVVPLFKQQIARGGPVTVTHPEMVRYFMTIPEAVQLVIQAGSMAQGGETFVLDMGEPVKIMQLAQTLIRLSGFQEDEIEIVITGMRPGEKLFEELLTAEEGVNSTRHERIYVAKTDKVQREPIEQAISEFVQQEWPGDQGEAVGWLQRFLPAFQIVRSAPPEDGADLDSSESRTSGLRQIAASRE